MEYLFLKIANISITASWVILAILILRPILYKIPKRFFCLMWVVAGIRLILPFSIESIFSLIPSTKTLTESEFLDASPTVQTGISSLNVAINPFITEQFAPKGGTSVNPLQVYTFIAGYVWLLGIVALVLYAVISYVRLRIRVREAVLLYDNIYVCDRVSSPFILGLIKPKIYLLSDINEADTEFVTEHEKAHIKRLDHIWKPIGFLLLTFYWFNPIIWVGYIFLCRDIELACDERVIESRDGEYKKQYSNALINCSCQKRYITACPLAFGETGVKARIKNVLSFKKPAVWIICAAAIITTALAVCFLTDPHELRGVQNQSKNAKIEITAVETGGVSPYIEIERKNHLDTDMLYGEEHYFYRKVKNKWIDCRIHEDYVYHLVEHCIGAKKTVKQRFYLVDQDMWQTGRYKLEVFYNAPGGKKQKTSVEFDLTQPIETIAIRDITGTEVIYSNGMFSYVPSKYDCKFRLQNGMNLLKVGEDTDYSYLGLLEEITLTIENFDKRIHYRGKSIGLRENNKRAWQLITEVNGIDMLYMLLEQKNGEYYFCEGYHKFADSDESLIRFIYKVELGTLIYKDETLLPTTDVFECFEHTDKDGCVRSLKLYHDGTFSMNENTLSSYFNYGTYYYADDKLFLHTLSKDRVIVFDVIDYNTLKFNLSNSFGITANTLPDGAEFELSSISPITSGSGIF